MHVAAAAKPLRSDCCCRRWPQSNLVRKANSSKPAALYACSPYKRCSTCCWSMPKPQHAAVHRLQWSWPSLGDHSKSLLAAPLAAGLKGVCQALVSAATTSIALARCQACRRTCCRCWPGVGVALAGGVPKGQDSNHRRRVHLAPRGLPSADHQGEQVCRDVC